MMRWRCISDGAFAMKLSAGSNSLVWTSVMSEKIIENAFTPNIMWNGEMSWRTAATHPHSPEPSQGGAATATASVLTTHPHIVFLDFL